MKSKDLLISVIRPDWRLDSGFYFDFTETSVQQDFYNRVAARISPGESIERVNDIKANIRKSENNIAPAESAENVRKLHKLIPDNAILVEIGGGLHQRRNGNLAGEFENYIPVNICSLDIQQYCQSYKRYGLVADAHILPFRNSSVDCVFTHTVLEHLLKPGVVLSEISRVLKPGGIVIHKDAWFCRWWQNYGVVGIIPFHKMNISERLIWLAAKFTDFPIIRFPPIVLSRLLKEIFTPGKHPIDLRFKPLRPNYNLHYACDEDATASIDPLDVIRFYESRGATLVDPCNLIGRLLFRRQSIIIKMGDKT